MDLLPVFSMANKNVEKPRYGRMRGAVPAGVFFLCLIVLSGCNSTSPPDHLPEPIIITAPQAYKKFLINDTMVVQWTPAVKGPRVSCTFNKGEGWNKPVIVSIDSQKAGIIIPSTTFSDSFQVMVEDTTGAYHSNVSRTVSVKYILVTSPAANDTFRVGDTVRITWRASTEIASVGIWLTTDNWTSSSSNCIQANGSTKKTDPYYQWIIGHEASGWPFAYPSGTCEIRVQDYNTEAGSDMTGLFTVR
jgi:uncharacterized protein YuzE